MSEHTPGPWTFSTSPEGWSHTIHVSQAEGAPYTTGYSDVGYIIQTCRGEEESTQTANARLIAAAPDLLEALKNLLGLVAHPSVDADETLLAPFYAAIAKATGE